MWNMHRYALLFLLLGSCRSQKLIEIETWTVNIKGTTTTTTAPGVCGIYTIAQETGLILEDLYYDYNDSDAKWIVYEDWVFSQVITAEAEFLSSDNVNLVLEGIDTIGTVKLNDVTLGQTNNMFVQYIYDVKQYLKIGENKLEITLNSPLIAANQTYDKYTYRIPPECQAAEYRGDCHVNMLRKMQASFSWDWGPSVPSMGIWKPAHFESFNDTVIRDIVTYVELSEGVNGSFWKLYLDVYFAGNKDDADGELLVQLDNFFEDVRTIQNVSKHKNELLYNVSFDIEKSFVETWWPNGFGNQPLYNVTVAFTSTGGQSSVKRTRVGFRTIELVQDSIQSLSTNKVSKDSIIAELSTDVNDVNNTFWKLNVNVRLANNNEGSISGKLFTKLEDIIEDVREVSIVPNANKELLLTVSYDIRKNLVGTDEYRLQVAFTSSKGETGAETVEVHFKPKELRDDTGLTFYFKVNGLPIFMKGSNLIPIDLRPEQGQNKDAVKRVLTTAKLANMNMIRIWGGGVYESDYLYEVADEMGILIWQDFMFACALYPSDPAFLTNVIQEVRHQVKRLYSHPSIALFSGNNENEGALVDNWWAIENKTVYMADYVKLYADTIMTEYLDLTGQKGIYVTSSPSNGLESASENYLAAQPGSSYYGDVHFYNYVADPFDPETYPIPRFCSEYGYQSLPSADSFLKDTGNAANINIKSQFMDYRQHHPEGNDQMKALIMTQLTLPEETSDNYTEAFIYYTQIIQAYSYKIQTEHYRNYRSILTADGRGQTMGALYWQLNDVWTAPTWASVDYYGKWKMAHYFAKEFFSPVIVDGHLRSNPNGGKSLDVFVVTDNDPLTAVVNLQVRRWSGLNDIVNATNVPITVQAGTSSIVDSIGNLTEALSMPGCKLADCYFYLKITNSEGQVLAENYVLPAKPMESNLLQPTVKVNSVKKPAESEETYEIEITTDNVALFVWIEAHGIQGYFSENGFLQANASKTVLFHSEQATSVDELKQKLTVVHLRDRKYFPN